MLRITTVTQTPEEIVLRLEGWVTGEGVGVLAEEGHRRLRKARRLVLDLNGVKSIDAAGLALLQGWSGSRLVLRGGSGYLRALLSSSGLESI
ncbi:MAG: STAS domain-containing protein [Gemmatimonadetes bacterium]|jgi:ABC-type transporter Mla MlaB component|nr:STAS domain-containing protein [Gemmatimonadota bacterium]